MKKRRSTIGADPLDAFLPPAVPKVPEPPREHKTEEKAVEPPSKPDVPHAGKTVKAVKVTYNVPEELVEETRNAVKALSGPPLHLTLSSLVESALRRELARLRTEHNGRRPFEGPGTALRGGRPIR